MKITLKISGFIVIIIIIGSLIQHLICPVYDFPPEKVFTGDNFYNPYENISKEKIIKANLHAHSKAWLGLTNGRNNNKEALVQRYKFLGYDIAGISDYQSINNYNQQDPLYIPEYEHGFGFSKNHQLSIGANEVLWNDYLIFQTTNNKQNILKELRSRSRLVAISHPVLRNAYDADDMKKLTDYDCIEILNNENGNSINLWDVALSSGHAVFGIGDDDSHSSENPHSMGCCYNIIYCDTVTSGDVINSLRNGKSITVEQHGETMELKKQKAINLPVLLKYDISNGMITINIDKLAKEISFIGQNGNIEKQEFGKNTGDYSIKHEDTYIRIVISFNDGTLFYLNPVFRTSSNKPENLSATVNPINTAIQRIILTLMIITVVILYTYLRLKKDEIKPEYAELS